MIFVNCKGKNLCHYHWQFLLPLKNMWKEILLTFLYWLLFNFLICRFLSLQFKGFKTWVTVALFNAKFAAGIFIWLVYTFYYTDTGRNDVHKFYNNAVVLRHIADKNPRAFTDLFLSGDTKEQISITELKNWNRNFDESPFNANRFIIRINTLLLFVSLYTYPVHVLFFSFFSLASMVLLVNALFKNANQTNLLLTLPVLFMPSVLFWNSGVMKEPVLTLGIGLWVSGMVNLSSKVLWRSIILMVIGAMLVLLTKFFVMLCILPPAVAYLIFIKKEERRFIAGKIALVYLMFGIAAFNVYRMVPELNFGQMLVNKYTHAVKEAAYFNAGSMIEIPAIENSAISILRASATGICNMLLRPFPWEAQNPMQWFSSIENLVFLTFLLIVLAFINWRSIPHLNLFLFCVCFAFGYLALTGMCTPVAGNMVRYKAPLLPLLYMAFCLAVNPKYVASTLNFLLRKNRG